MLTHESRLTDAPALLARTAGDMPEHATARAATVKVCDVAVPYTSGAIGEARVERFNSTDDEDRGGVVLRLTIDDQASSFVPTCRVLSNGIELHLAGEAEADAMIRAIAGANAAGAGPRCA